MDEEQRGVVSLGLLVSLAFLGERSMSLELEELYDEDGKVKVLCLEWKSAGEVKVVCAEEARHQCEECKGFKCRLHAVDVKRNEGVMEKKSVYCVGCWNKKNCTWLGGSRAL